MNSFGAKLRHERERRQIALRSIAETTKISFSLLDALERDDLSRWPSGIFRKSFIRSYAASIGVDPDAAWSDFLEAFPEGAEAGMPFTEAPKPASPKRVAIRLSVAWPPSLFGGRFAEWRKRWFGVQESGYKAAAIAAIMRGEKP